MEGQAPASHGLVGIPLDMIGGEHLDVKDDWRWRDGYWNMEGRGARIIGMLYYRG
jgi:hypothetical protein